MWQETGVDPPPYIMFLDSVIYLKNPAHDVTSIRHWGKRWEVMSFANQYFPDKPLKEAVDA